MTQFLCTEVKMLANMTFLHSGKISSKNKQGQSTQCNVCMQRKSLCMPYEHFIGGVTYNTIG